MGAGATASDVPSQPAPRKAPERASATGAARAGPRSPRDVAWRASAKSSAPISCDKVQSVTPFDELGVRDAEADGVGEGVAVGVRVALAHPLADVLKLTPGLTDATLERVAFTDALAVVVGPTLRVEFRVTVALPLERLLAAAKTDRVALTDEPVLDVALVNPLIVALGSPVMVIDEPPLCDRFGLALKLGDPELVRDGQELAVPLAHPLERALALGVGVLRPDEDELTLLLDDCAALPVLLTLPLAQELKAALKVALALPELLLLAQPLELTRADLEGSPERVVLALRVALRLALELASDDRERAALGDSDVEAVGGPKVELTQLVGECVALLTAERENEPIPEAVRSTLSVAEAENE